MKKILITGFEPFGGHTRNASWEAVQGLPDCLGEIAVFKKQLPVEYDRVANCLKQLLEEIKPDAVICVGQAGGRCAITPEKVAINWKSGKISDNAGVKYRGTPICEGPDAYFSSLPVEMIVSNLQNAGIPAAVSYTAGTYVCNCAMYCLLRLLKSTPVKGGFLHVPYTCEQAASINAPSLPLSMLTHALEIAIQTIFN